MVIKKFVLFFGMVFLMGCVFASFEIGNPDNDLTKIYGPEQSIQGWINASFSDETSNSIIEDSFGNSAEILDLLNTNSLYIYSCSPLDCESDYSASNPQSSKTFNLNEGQEQMYGLKFSENMQSINSVSFEISSNAGESCANPLSADILDDGTKDIISSNIGSQICTYFDAYGCFDASQSLNEYGIDDQEYCQKINLTEAPATIIGSWIKKVSGDMTLVMALYNPQKEEIGTCNLGEITTEKEYSCEIDYLVKEKDDYYVCIYSTEGSGDYKIRGYSNIDKCGFHGNIYSTGSFTSAYQIFAKPKSFGAVGTINVADTLSDGSKISEMVEEYINEKYGSLDCSPSDCIIPINFYGFGSSQSITIKNLIINYNEIGGPTTSTNFYDLTEYPAKINSDFGKLYVDGGNFKAPSNNGEFDFILSLNGSELINTNLSVENIPVVESVSPVKTASALPTEFEAKTSGSGNISKYIWNFGDNSTEITYSNIATHTYNSTGNFTMKITLEDSSGRTSSKTFSINVGSPKEVIEDMLVEKKSNLNSALLEIEEFSGFQRQRLDEILNLDFVQSELSRIDLEYGDGANKSEEQLNSILTDLLYLDVPEYITKGASADDLVFYPEKPYVNLDVLSSISGESYDYAQEDNYIDSLIAWNQIYLTTKVSFSEVYASYDGKETKILTTYEISISEREDADAFYFIIEDLEDLVFDGYSGTQEGSYTYITLTGSNAISFSTSEDIEFSNLPVFISPAISKLDLVDINVTSGEEGNTKKWLLFGLAIFLLILIGIGVYFALHAWYKKKYENYLFKDKNNLYNLINYIHTSQEKGIDKDDVIKNLKKAKWTNEQINYVMKKYAGKTSGMPGLVKDEKIKEISNRIGNRKVAKK